MIRLSDRQAKRLGDRLNDPPALPGTGADTPIPQLQSAKLDDATTAYVVRMREPFEQLRQASAQLAGLLVLAASSGQAIAGHPMLALASEALEQAKDSIWSAAIPARAGHHHRHAVQAAKDLDIALAAARRSLVRRDEKAIDGVLAPLRAAHQHLLWATSALPGFEVVALSQACCAQHAPLNNQLPQ